MHTHYIPDDATDEEITEMRAEHHAIKREVSAPVIVTTTPAYQRHASRFRPMGVGK